MRSVNPPDPTVDATEPSGLVSSSEDSDSESSDCLSLACLSELAIRLRNDDCLETLVSGVPVRRGLVILEPNDEVLRPLGGRCCEVEAVLDVEGARSMEG